MLLAVKYYFWYLISHYHAKCMKKECNLQHLLEASDEMFCKSVRKFVHHAMAFDRIQVKLDYLKQELCNKYPDLREEA